MENYLGESLQGTFEDLEGQDSAFLESNDVLSDSDEITNTTTLRKFVLQENDLFPSKTAHDITKTKLANFRQYALCSIQQAAKKMEAGQHLTRKAGFITVPGVSMRHVWIEYKDVIFDPIVEDNHDFLMYMREYVNGSINDHDMIKRIRERPLTEKLIGKNPKTILYSGNSIESTSA